MDGNITLENARLSQEIRTLYGDMSRIVSNQVTVGNIYNTKHHRQELAIKSIRRHRRLAIIRFEELEERIETLEREVRLSQLISTAQNIQNESKFAKLDETLDKLRKDMEQVTTAFGNLTLE